MNHHKRHFTTSLALALSLLLLSSTAPADAPPAHFIQGVERIKQMTNYCGPACLASVMGLFDKPITQETIGKQIYDAASRATNGADMLHYARENGFSAYSWNSGLQNIKDKLAAGIPVIVLQQNSMEDTSGHYRVLTGYDDARGKFSVMDPYYDNITEMTYSMCERLWKPMGFWALMVVPPSKDKFRDELDIKNPVVHMDLSYAKYKRKDYEGALREARLALKLEPENKFAISMLGKIEQAAGAGSK